MKRKRVEKVEDEPPKKKMKTFDEKKEILSIFRKVNEIFERSVVLKVEERKIKLIPHPVIKPKVEERSIKIVKRRKRIILPPLKSKLANQPLLIPRQKPIVLPRSTFSSKLVTSYYLCDCGRFWTHKFTNPTRTCRYCKKNVEILFSSNIWIWVPHK